MPKVTSKYQVTVPKAIADRYDIHPGDEIDWQPAGDVIRVVPSSKNAPTSDPQSRLRLFDEATERHRRRARHGGAEPTQDRGWNREDLYDRGLSH